MKMIITDFQEYVGTLATKYSDFEFKIDIKGGSFSSVADNEKERIDTTYTEKGEGTLLIKSRSTGMSITIKFIAEGKDVISDFPTDRLDKFVDAVKSVIGTA